MRVYFLRGAALLTLVVLTSGSLRASVVTIPDDYQSIQEAIDGGADTIAVREGVYSEIPQAYRGVTLLGLGARRPQLAGLVISNPYGHLSREWAIADLDFTGPVSIETPNYQARLLSIAFARCRLVEGLQHDLNTSSDPYDIQTLVLTHCLLGGPSGGRSARLEMHRDTATAGMSWGVEESVTVDSCWFSGGAQQALRISAQEVGGSFVGNLFEDAPKGFRLTNCEEVVIRSNVVRRITGIGMELLGKRHLLADNRISDCGVGLWYALGRAGLFNNTIVGAANAGAIFVQPEVLWAEQNVIGRCGGSAVFIQSPFMSDLRFTQNTFYDAGGSGIFITDGVDNTLAVNRNIGFGLGAYGLQVESTLRSSELGCNDWFANGLGAVTGVAAGETDVEANPGFCDVANDDVSLYSDSPLLSQTQCIQIGARGIGCSPPTLKVLSVASSRAGLGVAWAFEATTAESWIERADQAVGLWDSLGTGTPTGSSSFELLDAAVAPDRSYYYRVAWKDRGAVVHGSPVLGTWTDAGRLSTVTPNPAYREVRVEWVLASAGATDIRVFDLAGREVSVVAKGEFGVGRHEARWNGRLDGGGAAPAGMYIVRVSSGALNSSHRILLLR